MLWKSADVLEPSLTSRGGSWEPGMAGVSSRSKYAVLESLRHSSKNAGARFPTYGGHTDARRVWGLG